MSEVRRAGRLPIATRADFEREWARRHYLKYCQYVHHGAWIPGRHHELICEKLDAVVRGELKRLMICMPPRHGKIFWRHYLRKVARIESSNRNYWNEID